MGSHHARRASSRGKGGGASARKKEPEQRTEKTGMNNDCKPRGAYQSSIRWCTLMILFLCLGGNSMAAATAEDVAVLRTRFFTKFSGENSTKASTYLSSLRSDGSWPGIDYSHRGTNWKVLQHLDRIKVMSIAYQKKNSGHYRSATMLEGIKKALDFFYNGKFTTSHDYSRKMGTGYRFQRILVLMEGHITATQFSKGYQWLMKGLFPNKTGSAKYNYVGKPATGQNLVWLAVKFIVANTLKSNAAAIHTAIQDIGNELKVHGKEGVRADYGFCQHGPQLYTGSYGRQFMADISYWMNFMKGLSFSFNSVNVDDLSKLILDGAQWQVRRNYWDYACMGRNIVRTWELKTPSSSIRSACSNMISLNAPRKSEFQRFTDHVAGKNDASLTGNKHFWAVDYHAHKRADYHVGIKLVSTRTMAHEAGNGKNLQGYYLDQGAMTLMKTGLEYDDIYFAWDWSRIPGTTAPHKDPAPKPKDWEHNPGLTKFVGGASNGKYGTVGFDLSWDGVHGKKAWFLFEDEVVCLGAGITAVSTVPINTCLNQCLKKGEVILADAKGRESKVTAGERVLSSPGFVYHDGVGYQFPAGCSVKLKNGNQTGSAADVYRGQSSKPVTRNVFSLWLDHGKSPRNETYEYTLVPGTTLEKMRNYVQGASPIRVIANTTAQQAVRNDRLKVAGIVFHAPGTSNVRAGLSVTVDQKCIVLVDESGPALLVTVAQPENRAIAINVTLKGDLNKSLAFHMPSGPMAGSSLTLNAASGKPVSIDRRNGFIRKVPIHESPGSVTIYDPLGRMVRRWEEPFKHGAERQAISWDGKSQQGRRPGNGVYFYALETAKHTHRGRMLIGR